MSKRRLWHLFFHAVSSIWTVPRMNWDISLFRQHYLRPTLKDCSWTSVWFPQSEPIRQTKSCSKTLHFPSVLFRLWVKRATSQIHHLPDGRRAPLTPRFLDPRWQKLVTTWDGWPVCDDSSCRVKVKLNTAECLPGMPGSVRNTLLSTYAPWHLNSFCYFSYL